MSAESTFYGTRPRDDELPLVLPEGSLSIGGRDMAGWKLETGPAPSGIDEDAPIYRLHRLTWTGACHVNWKTVRRPEVPRPPTAEKFAPGDTVIVTGGAGPLPEIVGRSFVLKRRSTLSDSRPGWLTVDGRFFTDGVVVFEHAVAEPEPSPSPERERPVDPYVEHRGTLVEGDAYITDNRNRERRNARIAALASSGHPLDRAAALRAKRRSHIDAHREAFGRTWRDRMGRTVSWAGRVR